MSMNDALLTAVVTPIDRYVLCFCKSENRFEIVKTRQNHQFQFTGLYSDEIFEASELLKKAAEAEYPHVRFGYKYSTIEEVRYYCNFGLEYTLLNRG